MEATLEPGTSRICFDVDAIWLKLKEKRMLIPNSRVGSSCGPSDHPTERVAKFIMLGFS